MNEEILKIIERVTKSLEENIDPEQEINNAVRKILQMNSNDACIYVNKAIEKAKNNNLSLAELCIVQKVMKIIKP